MREFFPFVMAEDPWLSFCKDLSDNDIAVHVKFARSKAVDSTTVFKHVHIVVLCTYGAHS